ncbi:MAG: patatin-like phospholipase family protein [Pseudomonadota bacterium]
MPRIFPKLAGVLCFALAACAGSNLPINELSTELSDDSAPLFSTSGQENALVGLAFSGGGTRAAAYSYGVLKHLARTNVPGTDETIFDQIRYLSGVSGGSVTATYFGLHGRRAFADYEEAFLKQDAEAYLRTSPVRPTNLLRAISGGVNDRSSFGRWVDENLFKGATFADLRKNKQITTWIAAADIYNRLPFTFEEETFRALCSDLRDFPIAEAVAASAAVPIVFRPIVLEAYGPRCAYERPKWLTTAAFNTEASATLRAYAKAIENYRDPEKMSYVKLLDGAITDNFGLTSLSIARARSQTLHGPLSAAQAVQLDRMMFIVVNAGRGNTADWANQLRGPGGFDLVTAITDTATVSATREGFNSFRFGMEKWQQDLIDFRCALSPAEVRRYGRNPATFNCGALKLFVDEIGYEQLDDETQERMENVPTRLRLDPETVDFVIESGQKAAALNPTIRAFLLNSGGIDGTARRVIAPDG